MPAPPLNDRSWELTRDEVHRLIRADVWQGVSKWFDEYAEACLESDEGRCHRFVTEPFAFPDSVAELVGSRFGPATEAFQAGRSADAIERLTADSGETGQIVRKLAIATVPDQGHNEELKGASACGLRGIWFEAIGRATDAAAAYFEAGQHLGQLGPDHEEASVRLLGRATELDPTHAPAHWYLADAWRVRSQSLTPPYVDRPALEQSLSMWNRGTASHVPDAETSWAFVVRALIAEQYARLDDARRVSFWWEAVLYLERATLLDDSDAGRWALLGRCHRLLKNERASLHATTKALERNPDDANALEERAAILADTGAFDEARLAIDRRIRLDPEGENVWALGVKASILARQKDYRAARELIDQVIAAEPDNIWNLDIKATCCWMVGDTAGARDAYEALVRIGAAARLSCDDKRTCAFAAYRLGRTDEAIAALQELLDDPLVRDDVSRLLGLCYFVKGETRRAEELILSSITHANTRELDDFLSLELSGLESTQGGPRPGPRGSASLARIKTIAAALADRGRAPAGDARFAAEEELTRVLRSGDEADPPDALTAAAARAGVARLQLEGEHWRAAGATYLAQQRADGLFPEAVIGMARAVDSIRAAARKLLAEEQLPAALERFRELVAVETELERDGQAAVAQQELGDALWSAGRDAEAMEHFQEALAQASPRDAPRRADLRVRLAFAQLQHGEVDGPRENYEHALRLYRDAGNDDPAHALSQACRTSLRSADDFWRVDAHWRSLANDTGVDEGARADFACALDSLATYLDEVYRLSEPLAPETAMPIVTPIVLEVGSALVPLIDPASEQSKKGKFLNEDIPAMRARIHGSMGLRNMPGIRVRPQPSSTEGYVILLNGAAVASGGVRANSTHVIEPPDVHGPEFSLQAVYEAVDPASGLAGRWYPNARLKSEIEFILSHVETVLRQHLDAFLGADESRALLNEIQKEESHAAFASSVLNDSESLEGLTRVLHALLRENVPVTDWSGMIGAIKDCGLTNVHEAVREIRLRLKKQLPGNQEGATYIQVPAEWEHASGAPAGPIGASPELAHRWLVSTRQWLQSRTGEVALVTRSARLRPVVRRLIEYEFPSVPVLTIDEVVRPEQVVAAAEAPQLTADQ